MPSLWWCCYLLIGWYNHKMKTGDCHPSPWVHLTAAAVVWHWTTRLPPEAGFMWWFRCVFPLSSTIWNQCSWGQEDSFGSERASGEQAQDSAPFPVPPPLLSPLKDNWFLLVLRAHCSLLAPFEIGYKTVDHLLHCKSSGKHRKVWRVWMRLKMELMNLLQFLLTTTRGCNKVTGHSMILQRWEWKKQLSKKINSTIFTE